MSVLRGNQGPRYKSPDGEAAAYETISVDKLTPIIGAEIGGVDLAAPTNRQLDEIHRALAENLVIFFRDQTLTPEQHLDFGRHFGPLHLHPAAPHAPGHPELMVIHADKDSPRANGENWHSDVSCDELPPLGSILYIRTCPPHGGDTLFASMYAAYEALSERMQHYLEGLTALHDGEPVYRGLYANYGVEDKDSYPRAEHPVVRTHPVTGRKALYVNRGFTRRILGIPRDESEGVLRYLYEHMENPLFQCRFRWRADSVAFWDNRCVQHHALWDYWPHTRSGFRVTVRGERPV
ncbi:MAG: TauD/TfdA family dioxygenase [Rhodospirillales bacterium]|nr:TauD/TfdA family dioxygenase [Rhodospirillales bacterium]